MDSHENGQGYPPYPNVQPQQNGFNSQAEFRPNSFALAAMVAGIITIVFACVGIPFLPQASAALAIIFAILSKGNGSAMHNYAKTGITTALIGTVISITLIISGFFLIMNNTDYHKQANELCEEIYGQSFDDMLKELAPSDF